MDFSLPNIPMRRVVSRPLWVLQNALSFSKRLGYATGLRCVVFHDFRDHPSPLTAGLGVSITVQEFEYYIDFLIRHYRIVSLDQIINGEGADVDNRPTALITFDDAYRSVYSEALPLLRKREIPAVFFVNGLFIGNKNISIDNLVAYTYNRFGIPALNEFLEKKYPSIQTEIGSINEFLEEIVALFSRKEVDNLSNTLAEYFNIDIQTVVEEADLYLHHEDISKFIDQDIEIGSHTFSHSFCRALTAPELEIEIRQNKAVLDDLTGTSLRAFSVPYGSSPDLTGALVEALDSTGTQCIFLVEGLINKSPPDLQRVVRISPKSIHHESEFFLDLEVLPRLRAIRNRCFR